MLAIRSTPMVKVPDLSISPLMWIRMKEGLGAIHSGTILAIIPDASAPKTCSLVISSAFPEGLTVMGDSEDLLMQWWMEVGNQDEEDDDEDED